MSTPSNAEYKRRNAYFKRRARQYLVHPNRPNTSFVSAVNGHRYSFDKRGVCTKGRFESAGLLVRIRGMFRA
jgi:hypothetical protein